MTSSFQISKRAARLLYKNKISSLKIDNCKLLIATEGSFDA